MTESPITVYGKPNCEDTVATRQRLDALGIPYRYVNIFQDPAALSFVEFVNDGDQSTPTVVIDRGKLKLIVTEPTDDELDELLGDVGILK